MAPPPPLIPPYRVNPPPGVPLPPNSPPISPPPHQPINVEPTWEKHPQRNCWWGGHGAEEVDSPKGTAVARATTVEACKEACIAVSLPTLFCDGVLFDEARGKCYRKTSIYVPRCSRDPNFDLYVRVEANRPPAAPRQDYGTFLTSKRCSAMMRDPNHKFYSIWAKQGWSRRARGQRACWDDGNWFDWVAGGHNCDQQWGGNLRAPSVFGFAETMEAFCNDKKGQGWTWSAGDPSYACSNRYNVLRIGDWNMCRNAEWMICVIQGKGSWGGNGDPTIIFSLAPMTVDTVDFDSRPSFYSENDIYLLEVCTLNEMCSNYEEIFSIDVGAPFLCQFDERRWLQAKRDLLALG